MVDKNLCEDEGLDSLKNFMKSRSHILLIILAVFATSFYLFPIGFRGLPASLNTKQMLAVLGVFVFGLKCIWNRRVSFSKATLGAFAIACVFSVWCYFCTVANNTSDYSYATYFLSFVVWLGGAYAVCFFIKEAYGKVDLRILARVMAFLCVVQCISALLVDNVTGFRDFVDTWIIQDDMPKRVKRMYGLGISLDSGAVRLDMALMLIAYQLGTRTEESHRRIDVWTYYLAFFFISLVGSMIARTTMVGFGLGLLYIVVLRVSSKIKSFSRKKILVFFGVVIVIISLIAILVGLYRTDEAFRDYIRFAFEAFFNFFEHGEFRTASTDRLNEVMWIWPWSRQGWLIGYGHFAYESWGRFTTDIGYCRFTLYCGLIGMAIFSGYFIYLAKAMSLKFRNSGLLFLLLGAMTFIIWVKVSTDLFQLYALLLCLPATRGLIDSSVNTSSDV